MALCSMGYGKGASSFDFVDFCSSPSRQDSGVPKGASSQLSLPSGPRHAQLFRIRDSRLCRTRHRRLPSGIGTKLQSRPLTGSRVKKVSTKCQLRVDHVYSGTLSGTLILVPFSCHKTGTSSTSMERLQTGSLSNTHMHTAIHTHMHMHTYTNTQVRPECVQAAQLPAPFSWPTWCLVIEMETRP